MASLPVNFNQLKKDKMKEKPRPIIKLDYSSIKHPSTIQLISVVKVPQAPALDDCYTGLTKGELMPFINDPFWSRIRMTMMLIFGLALFGMLIGAIIIIATAPSCDYLQPVFNDGTNQVISNITSNSTSF